MISTCVANFSLDPLPAGNEEVLIGLARAMPNQLRPLSVKTGRQSITVYGI